MSEVAEKRPKPKHDNFFTPKNDKFYAHFQYVPLDRDQRCIRLLRIHAPSIPDSKASPITCDLLDNLSLDAMNGKYVTLSYCAGDPTKTEVITINGLEFNAFANLGHAVRQARHFWKDKFAADQDLLLWTDQVVINQSDPAERAHQVSFMGDIYEKSAQVLVSLSSEQDFPGGLSWLRKLNAMVEEDLEQQILSGQSIEMKDTRQAVDHMWHDASFHDGWDVFATVCISSPYWSRAWIRQEFIRPSEAHFMASFEHLDRHEFTKGFALYSDLQFYLPEHLSIQQIHQVSLDIWQTQKRSATIETLNNRVLYLLNAKQNSEIHQGQHGDLLDQLSYSHVCEATDPRDLVFALIGISNHSYRLLPDYSEGVSITHVLCQLTRKVIDHNGTLDILECAYARAPKPSTSTDSTHIPSWIPAMHYGNSIRPSALLQKQPQYTRSPSQPGILDVDSGGYHPTLRLKGILCKSSPHATHLTPPSQAPDQTTPRTSFGPNETASCTTSIDHHHHQRDLQQQQQQEEEEEEEEAEEEEEERGGEEEEEIWFLYGATRPFLLQKQGKNYKLIRQMVYPITVPAAEGNADGNTDAHANADHHHQQQIHPEYQSLYQKTRWNHPSIQIINLC